MNTACAHAHRQNSENKNIWMEEMAPGKYGTWKRENWILIQRKSCANLSQLW